MRRPLADRIMRALARLLVGVFFRNRQVEGGDRLPDGPVLVVANHINGLTDGLLLISELHRYPRFLGKHTLWKVLPLRPLLRLAGVVPIYRRMDGGADANRSAFARAHELLEAGGVVGIIPEGISHDEPTLQELRTGAARIALGAEATVSVVPVGLVYDAKARFRSSALVRVGEPITADGDVRALTDCIDAALREVGPEYESWEQTDELARIAEIVERPVGPDLPAAVALEAREQTARALGRHPDRLASVRAALREYERDLALVGLTDAQAAATYPDRRWWLRVVRLGVQAIVLFPVVAVGIVLNGPVYAFVKLIGDRPANVGVRSTTKLLASLFLYPVLWAGWGLLAWSWWGPLAAMAVVVLAPLSGWVVVRYVERVHRFGGARRGFVVVRSRRDLFDGILVRRAAVVAAARTALT